VAKRSAGLLLHRRREGALEVLLAHPGGPLWAKRDLGAWSIPKGEIEGADDALAVAIREFREETGCDVSGEFTELTPVRQAGGKVVQAWAIETDVDLSAFTSNVFEMEWPPRSGKRQQFPEIDRAAWLELSGARRKILPGQLPLLDELSKRFGDSA
jgi:predicted NUDIX family NTP pyrophosphohydrolase